MQQGSGMSTASARPINAQPLADLQQNVLSGCPRLQLNHKTANIAAKPVIPNECIQSTSIQRRLKAMGLSQYADAFAKEEIDEEVLPCLTVQDLQSLGVCNRAHQRLILSAAVQPATQQVARPPSRPHAAAAPHTPGTHAQPTPIITTHTSATHTTSLHSLPTDTSSKQDRGNCQNRSCSTDAVLPNKALPRGGLQGIASAVAANLTKGSAAAPSSSRLATGLQAVHRQLQPRLICKPFSAGTTVAGASAPTTRLCPPHASSASKGNVVPVRGAPATDRGALPAAKAVAVTATSTSTAAGAVAGTTRRVVTTAESVKATAKAGGAAAVMAHRTATAERNATTAGQAAPLPAPQTKAEEARQLAMALSASVSAGIPPCALQQGLVDPSQGPAVISHPAISQPASQAAASQGVFSTMMAASKHKSKSAAPTDSGIPLPAEDTCCSRSHEEGLLARIFASQAPSSAGAVVLSGPRAQGLSTGSSQAQPVSPSRSLWACAGRDDPPECQLHSRVQKRKAEAVMQAEVVNQQRAEQLRLQNCSAPDVSLASSQSELHPTALCGPCTVAVDDADSSSKSRCSAEADCIVLTSPCEHAHGKSSEGRCLSSQPSQSVWQRASAQTMDSVKRMRLQALQQELKAARQTVADLERMIKTEELN